MQGAPHRWLYSPSTPQHQQGASGREPGLPTGMQRGQQEHLKVRAARRALGTPPWGCWGGVWEQRRWESLLCHPHQLHRVSRHGVLATPWELRHQPPARLALPGVPAPACFGGIWHTLAAPAGWGMPSSPPPVPPAKRMWGLGCAWGWGCTSRWVFLGHPDPHRPHRHRGVAVGS